MRLLKRLTFLLVLGASGLAAFGTTPALAVGPCTDVQIIGLRGSGENPPLASQHSMGALVGPIADRIAEQAQGAATVSFYGLPYPAGDASITTVLSTSYFKSKDAGSAMLHSYLLEEIAACPSTRLVVVGYSQGAHAAGDQLAREPSSVTDHVAALVMFGDPRFNPAASYTWGTFDSRDHGLNGARSGADFASWKSRVYSFCNNGDLVCQGLGVGHSSSSHSQALYISNYGDLVAGSIRRRLGFPKPASATTPLDLAFVIDSTGSMGSSIAGVSTAAATMAGALKARGADFRVGLVDYKDTDQGDPYGARVVLPMTPDADAFGTAVRGLVASGGGDYPEAVFSGVMTAINQLSWRQVPRKAIILMGDAPAKDPEPVTGYTRSSVLAAARALDPAVIYPVAVGTGPLDDFNPLADGSGGQLFQAFGGSADVADQVLAAVDKASVPLFTSLTAGSPARPGAEVLFSAAASYYDDGDIVSYEWDFDGDGTIDATTPENRTSHIYDAPFSGIATVTAVTNDGNRGTATTPMEIRADAPDPPGAPQHLAAVEGSDHSSLAIHWDAPADLGSGALLDYLVEVDDASTGEPVLQAIIDPTTTQATAPDLVVGTYRVRAWAVGDGGLGDSAETMATVTSVTPPPPAFVFTGFLRPLVNPPALNRIAPGRVSRLRFSLGGDKGLDVLALGSPTSQQIDCKTLVPKGSSVPTSTPPNRALRYHARRGVYVYPWQTDRAWAKRCRQVTLTLSDGSEHRVNFKFDAPPRHPDGPWRGHHR